jgi:hypothetical protein
MISSCVISTPKNFSVARKQAKNLSGNKKDFARL